MYPTKIQQPGDDCRAKTLTPSLQSDSHCAPLTGVSTYCIPIAAIVRICILTP